MLIYAMKVICLGGGSLGRAVDASTCTLISDDTPYKFCSVDCPISVGHPLNMVVVWMYLISILVLFTALQIAKGGKVNE